MPQPVGIAARNRTKTVSPNLTVKETPLKPSMGQASATPALGKGGGSRGLRSSLATERVQGQLELRESLCQK